MLSIFSRDVLDEIKGLIDSVSEVFPTCSHYHFTCYRYYTCCFYQKPAYDSSGTLTSNVTETYEDIANKAYITFVDTIFPQLLE